MAEPATSSALATCKAVSREWAGAGKEVGVKEVVAWEDVGGMALRAAQKRR